MQQNLSLSGSVAHRIERRGMRAPVKMNRIRCANVRLRNRMAAHDFYGVHMVRKHIA